MTSLTGSIHRCQERRGSTLSALRPEHFGRETPTKGVGVQPGLKLSLLVSVSQSHGLSKIDGEYGQGSPNTIEIRRVYSQGEWDPSGRLHLAVVKVGLSKQTCRVDCFYSALMAYICSCMLRRWG